MSKRVVTVDNLNEEQFILDEENKKIGLVLPVPEAVDSLEVDDSSVMLAANSGRELKSYVDEVDNIFLGMVDAFGEYIYEEGVLPSPTVPIEVIRHDNGGVTYRALPEAEEDTFYQVSSREWLYVVRSNGLQAIVDQYKELLGVTPTVNITDSKAVTKAIPLRNVVTSKVTNMEQMFYGARSFDQDLSNWDTSNVTNMRQMFRDSSSFNQDLNNWNVSNVTNMSNMFYHASSFNGDISSWDTSKVTDMGYMFYNATSFNQPIGSWDVSKVTDMQLMFYIATSFNQDLSYWCVTNILTKPTNFDGNTHSWVKEGRLPVWGTCPRGEDQL